MIFLVFSTLQNISIWSPISNFEFPSKICSKNFNLNIWNFYLTSHTTKIDSKCIFLLLPAFWTSWIPPCGLLLWWLLGLCTPFLLLHADLLLWLHISTRLLFLLLFWGDFNSKISISHDQIGDQKRHFLNFSNIEETRKIIYLQLII